MARPLTIRQPHTAEIRQLHKVLEETLTPGQRRRAEAILLYTAGLAAVDIAQWLDVHPNTIYADLHAFGHYGIAAIHHVSRGGAPQEITPAQEAEIQRLAELPPYTLGLPYGRWPLAKLRAYLIQQHVLKTISREHLRRVLKKGGCTFVGSSANCSALIPNVAPF
jgi:transposase